MATPGHTAPPAPEKAPQPPQAKRVEADDNDPPPGDKHTLRLAEDLVGIGRKIQGVNQDHCIDAVRRHRQMLGLRHDNAGLPGIGTVANQGLPLDRAMFQVTQVYPQFTDLQQLVAEQIIHHAGQDLAFVSRRAGARVHRRPVRKRLMQMIIFFVAESGLRHLGVDAGTSLRHFVYSPAMTAANDNPDSDQSHRHRQRSCVVTALLLASVALTLGGCVGLETKPGAPESAAYPGPVQTDRQAPEPDQATDADDMEYEDVIWTRLRKGFRLSHISNPRIEQEIRRLQRSPNAFRALMARSEPYLYHILNRIEAAGLPTELALLPAVESGYRTHVYSPDGAAGLWQFMPATGRMLGLDQDWWFDRRRTVPASTEAATLYLEQLNARFSGDWLHTLAAYNAGAGTVNRAISRAGHRGEATDFWSIDLPGETDRYVPRLLALSAIVADPDAYGLDLPEISDQPYFAATSTGGQIDLNVAAQLADMAVEELLALNAGHKRWASPPEGPHELLLPVDRVEQFEVALATLPKEERMRWQRYRIQSGDTLSRIARQHGVTVQAIRRSNGLKTSHIRAGRDLLIPMSESVTIADSASNQLARQSLSYRVRKGDSLYTIAQRFQVSVPDLKRWNQVGRYIRPGEKLTVFVDPGV